MDKKLIASIVRLVLQFEDLIEHEQSVELKNKCHLPHYCKLISEQKKAIRLSKY